jgi:serine protease Do
MPKGSSVNSRKVFLRLVLVLLITLLSAYVVSAQKDSTPVPTPQDETPAENSADVLTLPILLDGEALELTLEGTTGAILAVFNASEGDEVDISMTSDELDPFIVVFDADARPVAMNDDGDDGLNSFIEGFEVPFDGSYFILATTFIGSSGEEEDTEGTFELLVEGNTPPAGIPDDSFSYTVYTIDIGESYDVEITEDIPAYFAEFSGEEGQEVTIDAPSEDLDTLMMLFDINGNRIAIDDDSGDEPLAAHIETELPDSGFYFLLVTTYNYEDIADGGDVTDGIINFSSQ